jgi:hypothetical protein
MDTGLCGTVRTLSFCLGNATALGLVEGILRLLGGGAEVLFIVAFSTEDNAALYGLGLCRRTWLFVGATLAGSLSGGSGTVTDGITWSSCNVLASVFRTD